MLLNAKKLHNKRNNPEMILLAIEDITERKQAEAEQHKLYLELTKANDALRAQVLIDDLTGLYNRRGFSTFAEQHIKLARRIGRELLLVFLDLDGNHDLQFELVRLGYGNILIKPFDEVGLLTRVAQLLEGKQAEEKLLVNPSSLPIWHRE